jgi:hypothetical protein
MAAAEMPVKILGLQVKRESVGEQPVQRLGHLLHGVG